MTQLFDLPVLLTALVALLVGALLSALLQKRKSPSSSPAATDNGAAEVGAAIRDYFKKSGVAVSAVATRLPGSQAFTAMVESEPMKRFRLSHIVEKSLVEHVRKACGLELEKVYWRFPIKDTAQPAAAKDEYIHEGLMNLKDLSPYEISEGSFEMFEATQKMPEKKD